MLDEAKFPQAATLKLIKQPTYWFTRFVNICLLVALSFIGGYAASENKGDVKAAFKCAYSNCVGCKAAGCEQGRVNPECGCQGCDGKCGLGKGKCPCDPLTCMDQTGCKCWCPGK